MTEQKKHKDQIPYKGQGIKRRSRYNTPGMKTLPRPHRLQSSHRGVYEVSHSKQESLLQRLTRFRYAIARFLANETKSGLILMASALLALVVANSPWCSS